MPEALNTDSLRLNESDIRRQIQVRPDLIESITVLPSVDSTSSYLLKQKTNVGKAKVCLAEAQTSGRGRRGNNWLSAPNRNVTLSLSWSFARWPETITGLGLAVGLVVAERLNKDYQIDVGIKWPNDLLINGEKLAGVLVDVTGDIEGACTVVLGLGLNVHQPDWSRPIEATSHQQPIPQEAGKLSDYAWTDLYSQGVMVNRNDLVANVINDWLLMLTKFEQLGFGAFVHRWNSLSCHIDKLVVLAKPEAAEQVRGKLLGVNDAGELLIRSEDGEQHTVSDSNLSLRLAS